MLLHLYYTLMVISFTISLFFYRTATIAVKMISQLLLASIVTEILVEICKQMHWGYFLLYRLFTPAEYTFIALYFYFSIHNKKFRVFCLSTIILFFFICMGDTIVNYNQEAFPRFVCYMECFLILIISTLTLLFLEPDIYKPIYKLSDFWFSIGFLFFFSGLFIVLFFDQSDKEIKKVFTLINLFFNCLLYLLLSVGFLCLKTKKKLSY